MLHVSSRQLRCGVLAAASHLGEGGRRHLSSLRRAEEHAHAEAVIHETPPRGDCNCVVASVCISNIESARTLLPVELGRISPQPVMLKVFAPHILTASRCDELLVDCMPRFCRKIGTRLMVFVVAFRIFSIFWRPIRRALGDKSPRKKISRYDF